VSEGNDNDWKLPDSGRCRYEFIPDSSCAFAQDDVLGAGYQH